MELGKITTEQRIVKDDSAVEESKLSKLTPGDEWGQPVEKDGVTSCAA